MHIDGKYFLAQSPKYFEAKAILSVNFIRIYDEENNELICEESKLAYPIIDGIPLMLKEKARKIKGWGMYSTRDCTSSID